MASIVCGIPLTSGLSSRGHIRVRHSSTSLRLQSFEALNAGTATAAFTVVAKTANININKREKKSTNHENNQTFQELIVHKDKQADNFPSQ